MAASLGFMEILVLLLLSGGSPGDVASMLPTESYLRYSNVAPDVESLMTWAAKEPADPKTQLRQLIAMRRLAEKTEDFAKSPKAAEHRRTLASIAEGKIAADPAGFAAQYAAKTLATLDGKKVGVTPLPANAAKEAWSWFPKNTTMAGYLETRGARVPDVETKVLEAVFKTMSDAERDRAFAAAETVGNIRVDRISFAIADGKGPVAFVRITGKANTEWLLKAGLKDKVSKTTKRDDGTPVRIAKDLGNSAMAIVGDSDILFVNPSEAKADAVALAEQRIAEIGKENPAEGNLKEDLSRVPKDASAIVVGKLPAEFARGLGEMAPERIWAFATRSQQGVGVDVQMLMPTPDSAKNVAEVVGAARKQALDNVAQLQGVQIPGMNVPALTATLQSLQVQAGGPQLGLQVLVHPDVFSSTPLMMFGRQKALQPRPAPDQ